MSEVVKVDPKKVVDLDWSSEREHWNEYKLSDGTTLKVKVVLVGVKRSDQYRADGNPIYMIESKNVVRALNVAKKLKKKPRKNSQVV